MFLKTGMRKEEDSWKKKVPQNRQSNQEKNPTLQCIQYTLNKDL